MATLTTIGGYLYDCRGTIIVTGTLYLAAQSDFISVDGTKVAPFTTVVNLSAMSPPGNIQVSLYATVGATPSGLAYYVYYDPDPLDTSQPARTKEGFWENYWSVPNTQTLQTLGSFPLTLRGQPSYNYLPVSGAAQALTGTSQPSAGASAGYVELPVNGTLRRIPIYATT
jgi:hypothetical protein